MIRSPLVPLGEVLVLDRDEVVLQPEAVYRTAGIYSFGKGLFEREPLRGSETSYASLFRLKEGQFVVSRLNGWEGAVDVVTPPFDGCFVSSEFPTFTIRRNLADPGYLRWIARWPTFWEMLVPRGSMIRRKRVQPSQLLSVEIPLPTKIDEQRRIAGRLDRVAHQIHRIQELSQLSGQLAVGVRTGLTSDGTESWPEVRVGDVLSLSVDAVPVSATESYKIAGVYSFGRGLFGRAPLVGPETSYKQLHRLHTDGSGNSAASRSGNSAASKRKERAE